MSSEMLASAPKPRRRDYTPIIGTPRRYTQHKDDYVSRFKRLVRKWRAETAYVSSTTDLLEHPAVAEIISMGDIVVPLIIDELRVQPDQLVGALVRITGENPISPCDRGDIYAMAAAWIEWHEIPSR